MAYTPINWDENTRVDATKLNQMDNQIDTNENDLRTIQGGTASVDGRITQNESDIDNIETYSAGNNLIFQSPATFSTTSSSFTTAKEFMIGKNGNIRLDFDIRINGSSSDEYVYYRVLVDGSSVASGGHSGTSSYINYTEDVSVNIGSNVKIQIRDGSTWGSKTVYLTDLKLKISGFSDNITEL